MLLGLSFHSQAMREAWPTQDRLAWIHWCGAGVDSLLFEELVASDVVLTNSRGVFDRAMAEYTLGLIIAFAKHLPQTIRLQTERRWEHRLSEQLLGRSVLIVGAGSIGREIARVLSAFGLDVQGVGRSARSADPDFGEVHAVTALDELLPEADIVVLITPSTSETYRLFGARQFSLMKSTSQFINLSRGAVVDEAALTAALGNGEIAAAGLDVFETEPAPAGNPLFDLDNVVLTPHLAGPTFESHTARLRNAFDNVERVARGEAPLWVIPELRA